METEVVRAGSSLDKSPQVDGQVGGRGYSCGWVISLVRKALRLSDVLREYANWKRWTGMDWVRRSGDYLLRPMALFLKKSMTLLAAPVLPELPDI